MFSHRILNSKQVREVLSIIESQWGARTSELREKYAFLINSRNRIFVITRDAANIDFPALHINSMGLYFGELSHGVLRLTIEGSQIIGPSAKRNIAELSSEEMKSWLRGSDLSRQCDGCSGFVIVKHESDFLGCGRYANGVIKNFVPKTRRIRDGD
ncbi:hypothetical protein HYU15_03485 [Candidatus Woesearchaeota archaeon]|nr:hypothetical protein [Candidatus Woesearchaeota archaeon]